MNRIPAYLLIGGWEDLSEESLRDVAEILSKVLESGTLPKMVVQDHPQARKVVEALGVPAVWARDLSDVLRLLGVRVPSTGTMCMDRDATLKYIIGSMGSSTEKPFATGGETVGIFQGLAGDGNRTSLFEVRARVMEASDGTECLVFRLDPTIDEVWECMEFRILDYITETWWEIRIQSRPFRVILDILPVRVLESGTDLLCAMTAYALVAGMGWIAHLVNHR